MRYEGEEKASTIKQATDKVIKNFAASEWGGSTFRRIITGEVKKA